MNSAIRSPAAVILAAVLAALAAGCRRAIEIRGKAQGEDAVTSSVETPPYLSWPEKPTFTKIPGTGIVCMSSYAGKPTSADYYICRVDRLWYWPYRGGWFIAPEWRGPWKPAKGVPAEFLKIPAADPRHAIARLHPDSGR
jgi:hypothetical protein